MLKVMLINPPQTYFRESRDFDVYFPIGLLSIAAMVKDKCKLKLLDCLVTDFEVKTSKDTAYYGASAKKIKMRILDFNPDIIGVTTPFFTQAGNAKAISKICKEINPNVKVVFGGPEATVKYKFLLEEGHCDYCVIGEGEKTFNEFIEKYQSEGSVYKIEGLAHKVNGRIDFTPRKHLDNLDELPFPAYDIVNVNEYLNHPYVYKARSRIHKNSISMITSRGCPYNCVFCSIKLHMGKKFRYHSPEYVFSHIRYLLDNYGITNFHFEDDNLSLNKSRFEKILDMIIDSDLKIKWDAPNGIRADSLDYNLLKKMKKSGCIHFNVAVESGNQHVLNKIIKKGTSLERMIDIIKDTKKLRMNADAFYVIGFPGETIENIKETLDLALKLLRKYGVVPNLTVATPLYGTELFKTCVQDGLIDENDMMKNFSSGATMRSQVYFSTSEFSKKDIEGLVNGYRAKLTYELIRYSIKHPFIALKRISDKPSLLKRFLYFKQDAIPNNLKIL